MTETTDIQRVIDAKDPKRALIAGKIIEAMKEIIEIAELSNKSGVSSDTKVDYAKRIDTIITQLRKDFGDHLLIFIQSLKPTYNLYKAHCLAKRGFPQSILYHSSITKSNDPSIKIDFNDYEDKEHGVNNDLAPHMRGGGVRRNAPIPIEPEEIKGSSTMGELLYIASRNPELPPKFIKSPIPNGLSNGQLVEFTKNLGPQAGHLNIESPADFPNVYGISQLDSAALNEELCNATMTIEGLRVNVGTIYQCATEFTSILKALDLKWGNKELDVLASIRESIRNRSTFNKSDAIENAIKVLQELDQLQSELKETEASKIGGNQYRSVSLLGILAKLYTEFHDKASTNKKELGHEGSGPYFTLLSKLCSVIMLELSDKHIIPENMPDLLKCITHIEDLFKKYVENIKQHNREERLIAIYNILKVIIHELEVFKYNVKVELARNQELLTADELVWHFVKIYKAWFDLKRASRNDIQKNNHEFLSACAFEKRKLNPELQREGPAIIDATEQLIDTLQTCYSKLDPVVITDQGAFLETSLRSRASSTQSFASPYEILEYVRSLVNLHSEPELELEDVD